MEEAQIIEQDPVELPEPPKAKKPRAAKLSETKPKDGGKKKKKKTPPKLTMSVDDIQQQIIGAHFMLGVMIPGVMITEEAAMNEAIAIKRIIDIYGMEWLEKFTPWVMLAIAVGMGEMPTMIAIKEKIAASRKPKLELVKEPMNDAIEQQRN